MADLLDSLRAKETSILLKYGHIKHPSLIGNMYEGLTKEILEKAIFSELNLSVVDGKIKNDEGKLSDQIDCMLVEGEGEQIPYTSSYIYPISQVLTVVEVKKNLFTNELKKAYANLNSINALRPVPNADAWAATRHAFRLIGGLDVTEENWPQLPKDLNLLYRTLAHDAARPVRVVMGFHGFASPESLGDALVTYIEDEMRKFSETPPHLKMESALTGFGPADFPNLVLCNESALMKFNGMPFGARILSNLSFAPEGSKGGPWWPFYGFIHKRTSLCLLEVIWTRLRRRFPISAEIFGEDLTNEQFNLLLFVKPHFGRGWEFVESLENVKTRDTEWNPVFLEFDQAIELQYLGAKGEIAIDSDAGFVEAAAKRGLTADDFAQNLVNTGLVFLDLDRKLRYLTEKCAIAFLPDGRIVAGDEDTGRLSRWIKKNVG